MIYDSPKDWKDLQEKVCNILNEVGFKATTNEPVTTPRGTVEIDVYAIDPFSIDKLMYIVECKNWENNVPQAVIHSFTTVMQETGANVGYIISKVGFQKGAYKYIQNTAIKVFTFDEFQKKYLKAWACNYLNKRIYEAADSLIQYTEPINSHRERVLSSLALREKNKFVSLKEKYFLFAEFLLFLASGNIMKYASQNEMIQEADIMEIESFKKKLHETSGIIFNATCYSKLLKELEAAIKQITNQFNELFGKDIFHEQN